MIEDVQIALRIVLAAVASFWYSIPELTQALIGLMIIDIVLGLIIAIKDKTLSPQTAYEGMTKKIVSLLLVGAAAVMNPHIQSVIEINLIQAASAFYIVPELTSITRNAASLGVPVFSQMQSVLAYFKAQSNVEESTTIERQ